MDEDGDKFSRSTVLVVGGSPVTPGAVTLAGMAALRMGAGRLQIATAAPVAPIVAVAVPEALVMPVPVDDDGAMRLPFDDHLVDGDELTPEPRRPPRGRPRTCERDKHHRDRCGGAGLPAPCVVRGAQATLGSPAADAQPSGGRLLARGAGRHRRSWFRRRAGAHRSGVRRCRHLVRRRARARRPQLGRAPGPPQPRHLRIW
ncbi:MAG: hypothetical protein HZB15_00025 [Actinobacteria bacterium]|nr:hypothetical protein [Actinomycetota bacterium]